MMLMALIIVVNGPIRAAAAMTSSVFFPKPSAPNLELIDG